MSLRSFVARPRQHPELLPTFRLGLLGVALGLAFFELEVGGGGGLTARVLAPLVFGLVSLLPVSAWVPGVGTVSGLLLAWGWADTPSKLVPAALVSCCAVLVGVATRRFLLPIEWDLASRKVMGTLLSAGRSTRSQEVLRDVLSLVRELSGAHAVLALRQLDEVSAETLVAVPDAVLPESLASPRLFAQALEQGRCLYHRDYARVPGASRFLLAEGARSVAVLPLRWSGQGGPGVSQGAILLIWRHRAHLHAHLRRFVELLLDELRTLLQFSDAVLRVERLQARYGAILETVPQGVVFVEGTGEQGWVNQKAGELLGLPPGGVEPMALAQAMARLRSCTSNPEELAAQGARLYTNPQTAIRDWLWTFHEPKERVLSVSSTPTRVRDFPGRLWLLDDVTEEWRAQQARLRAEEALRLEQEKTERLLLNMLPQSIAKLLKQEARTIAEGYAEATILFADIVDFTQLAERVSPEELIYLLNEIFSAFDQLTEKHGLEKIKTIGDAYMVAGGLPEPTSDHAEAIAEMALDMREFIEDFNRRRELSLRLRSGINTGPVVAGVIGTKKFHYDLWGDTVNTASRMESHGLPGHIHVTQATYERLQGKYTFTERGRIPIKGKGEMTTWLLEGRKN